MEGTSSQHPQRVQTGAIRAPLWALGIDPAEAAPDYWYHVHNRLSVNEVPRVYTRARHQAWLHRRSIAL
jgi:uncharacterized protein DUF2840